MTKAEDTYQYLASSQRAFHGAVSDEAVRRVLCEIALRYGASEIHCPHRDADFPFAVECRIFGQDLLIRCCEECRLLVARSITAEIEHFRRYRELFEFGVLTPNEIRSLEGQ